MADPARCKRRILRLSRPPRLRADAARTARLLAAARDQLVDGDGTVSLERVAQAAGTGIATLYRRFRTRAALVEAVYLSELDALLASGPFSSVGVRRARVHRKSAHLRCGRSTGARSASRAAMPAGAGGRTRSACAVSVIV